MRFWTVENKRVLACQRSEKLPPLTAVPIPEAWNRSVRRRSSADFDLSRLQPLDALRLVSNAIPKGNDLLRIPDRVSHARPLDPCVHRKGPRCLGFEPVWVRNVLRERNALAHAFEETTKAYELRIRTEVQLSLTFPSRKRETQGTSSALHMQHARTRSPSSSPSTSASSSAYSSQSSSASSSPSSRANRSKRTRRLQQFTTFGRGILVNGQFENPCSVCKTINAFLKL